MLVLNHLRADHDTPHLTEALVVRDGLRQRPSRDPERQARVAAWGRQ